MKTLNQTIFAISLIMLTSVNMMANNYRTLKMPVSGGKVLEILVKLENTVEETIPGYEATLREERKSLNTLSLPVYTEEVLEEVHPLVENHKESSTMVYFGELLKDIKKSEVEVEENEPDTKAIFEGIRSEKAFNLTNEMLSAYSKTEPEVAEPNLGFVASSTLTVK